MDAPIPLPGTTGWPQYVTRGWRELESYANLLRRHVCPNPGCKFKD